MTRVRFMFHVLGIPVVLLCWGCAATLDAVPIGTWTGEGQWHNPTKAEADGSNPQKGTYTVTVTTTRLSVDDRKPLAIEVIADHSNDPPFPHKCVYVLLALADPQVSDDGSLRLEPHLDLADKDQSGSGGINATTVGKLLAKKAAPPARLTQSWGTSTLEVRYFTMDDDEAPDFVETYTFSGDRLIKKGQYKSREKPDDVIEWTETLRKVR